ncbi:MAG TPA: lipoyl(octanoyl) transferase LipB [Tepidiformaceae bacterium]|nr:lipoyl(octanoyl) transferase LipB [Tepidiformaceae bacterium]
MARCIKVHDLGLTDYRDALDTQRELQAARIAGEAPDTLLLTEHRPVLTLGRAHPAPDLRVPAGAVQDAGIEIVATERGGDITYHGPGQLVAYGIVDLRGWDLPLLDYVAGLEQTVIRLLARRGIEANQRHGARGVWVEGRKIASVGIHVRRWVTMHGIALNVAPDMAHFELINPCGLAGIEMTSMERELGTSPPMTEVKAAFVDAFAEVFRCESVGSPVHVTTRPSSPAPSSAMQEKGGTL